MLFLHLQSATAPGVSRLHAADAGEFRDAGRLGRTLFPDGSAGRGCCRTRTVGPNLDSAKYPMNIERVGRVSSGARQGRQSGTWSASMPFSRRATWTNDERSLPDCRQPHRPHQVISAKELLMRWRTKLRSTVTGAIFQTGPVPAAAHSSLQRWGSYLTDARSNVPKLLMARATAIPSRARYLRQYPRTHRAGLS